MEERVIVVNVDPSVHCREAANIIKANPNCTLTNLDLEEGYNNTCKTDSIMGILRIHLAKGNRCKVSGENIDSIVKILESTGELK